MPSTIASLYETAARRGVGSHGATAHAAAADDWSNGFIVLDDLIGMVRHPQTLEDELEALAVLRRLHEDEPVPPEAREQLASFERHVELLGPSEVQAILGWIRTTSASSRFMPGLARHRAVRGRLTFVLMAAIVARYFRFEILRTLDDLQVLGGHEQLDELLAWMRTPFLTPAERQAARAYLDLSRRVLFEHLEQRVPSRGDVTADEFGRWPWTRQIQALQTLRERWMAQEGRAPGEGWNSPVIHAHTLEFRLARGRMFGRLARRGGWVAREALAGLGYSDWVDPARTWPGRRLLLLAVLIASTATVVWATSWRLASWNRAGQAFATSIVQRLGPAAVAPAPGSEVVTGPARKRQDEPGSR